MVGNTPKPIKYNIDKKVVSLGKQIVNNSVNIKYVTYININSLNPSNKLINLKKLGNCLDMIKLKVWAAKKNRLNPMIVKFNREKSFTAIGIENKKI